MNKANPGNNLSDFKIKKKKNKRIIKQNKGGYSIIISLVCQ